MMGEKFDAIKKVKWKAFILNYVESGNATEAYRKAYKSAKMTVAGVNGHELLKNTEIQAAIKERFNEIWIEKITHAGKVFDTLLKIGYSDIRDVVEYKGGVMTVKDFDKIDTRAIQSITQTVTPTKEGDKVTVNVKLYDKTKAVSELLRVLGMIQPEEQNISIKVIKAVRPDRRVIEPRHDDIEITPENNDEDENDGH